MTKTTTAKSKAGQQLVKARRKKRIKRVEAASRLNVSQDLIKAFDDWSFSELPELSEPLHMPLRRYARLVGLSASVLEKQLPAKHQQAKPEFSRRKGLFFVSRAGYVAVLGLVVLAFIGFIGWRSIRANAIPELTIISPQPNSVLDISKTNITGRTSEGAQVFINGTSVPVETNGDFSGSVILAPGPNNVEIRAINSFAREHTIERVIIREP